MGDSITINVNVDYKGKFEYEVILYDDANNIVEEYCYLVEIVANLEYQMNNGILAASIFSLVILLLFLGVALTGSNLAYLTIASILGCGLLGLSTGLMISSVLSESDTTRKEEKRNFLIGWSGVLLGLGIVILGIALGSIGADIIFTLLGAVIDIIYGFWGYLYATTPPITVASSIIIGVVIGLTIIIDYGFIRDTANKPVLVPFLFIPITMIICAILSYIFASI